MAFTVIFAAHTLAHPRADRLGPGEDRPRRQVQINLTIDLPAFLLNDTPAAGIAATWT